MRWHERRDCCNRCIRAISPGTAGGPDSPWLPRLSLPASRDVAELEQALALAPLQHPRKNFKARFMAGRSGLKAFLPPRRFQ